MPVALCSWLCECPVDDLFITVRHYNRNRHQVVDGVTACVPEFQPGSVTGNRILPGRAQRWCLTAPRPAPPGTTSIAFAIAGCNGPAFETQTNHPVSVLCLSVPECSTWCGCCTNYSVVHPMCGHRNGRQFARW